MRIFWRQGLIRGGWLTATGLAVARALAAGPAPDFERDVFPLLNTHCMSCHDADDRAEVGLDLERFASEDVAVRERQVWQHVFEKIESQQMPPPKRTSQPSDDERARLLAWIRTTLAKPDPALGARDPGKPVLRRLNRLEYNNTVRDLLELDRDVLMFSERLPVVRSYFQPASGRMPDSVHVRTIEYGGQIPVLLPNSGLPAENRAEHGYANRGDAMNFSPLLLEKYLALAGEIAQSEELIEFPFHDRFIASPDSLVAAAPTPARPAHLLTVGGEYSGGVGFRYQADGNSTVLYQFRTTIRDAKVLGRAGVIDAENGFAAVPAGAPWGAVFGRAGEKLLRITADVPVTRGKATGVKPISGNATLVLGDAGTRQATLTLALVGGAPTEALVELGLAVLRPVRAGVVKATARMQDGRALVLLQDTSVPPPIVFVPPAPGSRPVAPPPPRPATNTNIFFSFRAPPGTSITSLTIEDSAADAGLVLDDIGFVTARVRSAQGEAGLTVAAARRLRGEAEQRIAEFLPRAFRRPVSAAEIASFVFAFDRAAEQAKSFEAAMRSVLRSILVAPDFLYLAEPVQPSRDKVRTLDDHELAVRLSYFLWSSMPDAELQQLVAAGRLAQPEVLGAQVQRMLRDPKAKELSESFAVQWLRLDQLFAAKPDRARFGAFYAGSQGKDTLHLSMLVEALLFFETIMIEDRSVLELVDADFSYLNERLRRLYGIEAPAGSDRVANADDKTDRAEVTDATTRGPAWRRTPLPDRNRGGIMTMAGPLTVTSLPTRTSPVKRGAWLLETVFNRPPQEPKFAFALTDQPADPAARPLSVRERFEAHRTQAACYSCHVRLDPPGFALEAFSPIGEFRREDDGAVVDASGEWNGTPFDGPAGFKAAVMRHPDEFLRGFVEHLLSYALGRKLEHYDMVTVDEIQAAVREQHYRFSAVIHAIVRSYSFRHVRNVPAPDDKPLVFSRP